jgi:spartin
MEFSPATHARVRKINTFTTNAAQLSSKTVGQATSIAQNIAARAAGHKKNRPAKGFDEKGNPLEDDSYKPGFLNKSMIAFSTVLDGVATSGRHLLETSGAAASHVVGHRYGDEAGSVAANLAGGVKNVGLVYIDVTGVSRRAVIKSVAKGMVVGRVRGGGDVVVGGGDGGVIPDEDIKKAASATGSSSTQGGFHPSSDPYEPVGFGSGAPPKYQEFGQKN